MLAGQEKAQKLLQWSEYVSLKLLRVQAQYLGDVTAGIESAR